jgi:hypothetical protein
MTTQRVNGQAGVSATIDLGKIQVTRSTYQSLVRAS